MNLLGNLAQHLENTTDRTHGVNNLQSWTKIVETHHNDQPFFPWCEFSPLPS